MTLQIAESSGNVFRDLGFDAKESEDLKLRSELITAVRDRIAERIAQGDSQTDIAILLGVTQPRVSNLTRGKIGLFSAEALVNMLGRLGAKVEVSVVSPRRNLTIDVVSTPAAQLSYQIVGTPAWPANVPIVTSAMFTHQSSSAAESLALWAWSPAGIVSIDSDWFEEYGRATRTRPVAANTQLALAA